MRDAALRSQVAHGAAAEEQNQQANLVLRITAVLQTTLEVSKLVELFSREVQCVVPHDSVSYSNEEHGIELSLGRDGRHSCSYGLVVEGRSLGQICFTRNRKFPEPEFSLLEYLLCSILYPLRNALDFRRAVEDARRDPLTGACNRGVVESMLRREIGLARRHHMPLSVVFMDLDGFKSVNDDYGHGTGDRILKTFVRCVEQNIRATDVLARYGGDEFVLLLNNTPQKSACLLAERIRRAVERADLHDDLHGGLRVTVSMGVASLEEGDTVERLLGRADKALSRSKRSGRNRVSVSD